MDALKLAGVKNLPAFTQTARAMKLPIVRYGDPVLRAKGRRIAQVDEHIRELAANMIETMHEANGVGLAAQQVGEALQLTVIDVGAVRGSAEHDEAKRRGGGAEDVDAAGLVESGADSGRGDRSGAWKAA